MNSIPTKPAGGKGGRLPGARARVFLVWFPGGLAAACGQAAQYRMFVDCHFLPPGKYEAVSFADGINANREATDYKRTVATIAAGDLLPVHLVPGGGWAAVRTRK